MQERTKIYTFIHRNSYPAPLRKGRIMYNNGAVKSFQLDENKPNAYFKVKGTHLYTVEILNFTDSIKTKCNCHYSYGGLCKHKISALFKLDDYFRINKNAINQFENRVSKLKRRANSWLKIDKNDITQEFVESYTEPFEFSRVRNYVDYTNIQIINYKDGKEITFRTEIEWEVAEVKFKMENNDLFTKCSCNETIVGLCEHQAVALLKIVKNYEKDFFKCLSPDYIENYKNQILNEYDLPENTNFQDYFEFELIDGKLQAEPARQGEGLLKFNKTGANKQSNLSDIFEDDSIGFISNVNTNKKTELEIGYAFAFENNNEINELVELTPIYGKPNKAQSKLSTHIRRVAYKEYNHYLNISESDEKLIHQCKLITKDELINFYARNEIDNTTNEGFIANLKYYRANFETLIPNLKDQKYLYMTFGSFSRNDLIPIKISDSKPEIKFKLTENDKFYNLETVLILDNEEIPYDTDLYFAHLLIIIKDDTFYFIDSVKDALILKSYYIENKITRTTKQNFNIFFDEIVKPIAQNYPIEIELSNFKTKTIKLEAKQKRLYISELGKFVIFKPFVLYDNNQSANILQHGNIIEKRENTITTGYRDPIYEKEFYELFKNLHPNFKNQYREDFFHLKIDDLVKNYWFFEAFEKLKQNEIEVFGLKELKNFKYSPHKANVSINIASGMDWFDVKITVKFGDTEISLKDVRKAVMKNDRFIKLGDGSIGLLPQEWLDKFTNYFRQGQVKDDNLKISKLKFSIIDELFEDKDFMEIQKELYEKREKLKKFTKIKDVKIPKKLEGTLRDYQKSGYNWLNFLHDFKWGGILADDMGLGKTIQILTFLLKQKSKKPNLIIMPATLLFNWENEINKFTPSLTVYFHYGTARISDTKIFKDYDLIITTYGVMSRDIELLKNYKFNYIILDESQAIKNPNSQRFKASTLLRANNRLALTGTPIENNTFDLYAQMEFLNPGFLGTQKQFKDNYSTPIDRERDPGRAAELQNIITPFVLRRTKEQVATELPPKTEDYVFCEMDTQQRKVYDAFRNKYRNLLLKRIEKNGLGKSKIYVIEGLMKLRQICDSPEILNEKENYGTDSVKIRELIRHINEKTGKHKILVFSQFVRMLKLIQKELVKENIVHEYLDGQNTQKARKASVENFQTNKKCRVFLISLKAGGTGINLTEADYVYIVDPWWNPAVENQAIDRCYRIGQDKKVIAYRMICKNTIEEKIMEHQAKKRQIASDIITTDESFVKQLGKNDISKLFE